jgi:cysteinyl-tRNA synthetase
MAEKLLGADFEIHGGGSDLVFPHHENEIAQTEAGRGVPLARIWMHNGMVQMAEAKMSKSLGNIFQLSVALDRYGRDTVVAYLTSGHYRQPLEFSERALREAAARVERIRNFVRELPVEDGGGEDEFVAAREEALLEALADDFNTPRALAALFELIAEANRRPLAGARSAIHRMLPLLGLESLQTLAEAADPEAEGLKEDREAARAARDYERADRIRDELASRGYDVRDTAKGPRLVRRPSSA